MSEGLNPKELANELEEILSLLEEDSNSFCDEDQYRMILLQKLERDLGLSLRDVEYFSFIPEDEWEEHARQLAIDCDFLPNKKSPLINYIDWDRWSEDMKNDYETVDFEGVTYYYLSDQ
jgi:hypothetical protein